MDDEQTMAPEPEAQPAPATCPKCGKVEVECECEQEQPEGEMPEADESCGYHVQESFGHFVLLHEAEATGAEWDVLVIQEGQSLNGNVYGGDALRKAAPLFESAGVFAYELGDKLDHLPEAVKVAAGGDGGGLLRNRIGELSAPTYEERNGVRGIYARLRVAASWAREALRDIWAAGQQRAVGFSIDAKARLQDMGNGLRKVLEIAPNPTLDLVSHPAAGGRLLRVLASVPAQTPDASGGDIMPEQTPAPAVDVTAITESLRQEVATKLEAEMARVRLAQQIGDVLRTKVAGSNLPTVAQGRVLESIGSRTFAALPEAEQAIDAALAKEREYLAALPAPAIAGFGGAREAVQAGADGADKLQVAMDGFFAGRDLKTESGTVVPRFRSVHESIEHCTGKRPGTGISFEEVIYQASKYAPAFSGRGEWNRRTESVAAPGSNFRRVQESISSSTFGQILGDSITRRMMSEYAGSDYNNWRAIVSDVVPIKDFRTQRRQMFGWYDTLSTVTEGQNYPDLTTPGDDEETYAIAKRGGLETITLETIANDDVGLIRRIPGRLANSAALTLHQAIMGLFTTNANMYDGVALFDAAHSNTNTTALSGASAHAVRVAMMKQAPYGGSATNRRLGPANAPKFVLIPVDLEDVAYYLTHGPTALFEQDGTTAPSDLNATVAHPEHYRSMVPIIVPYWTNTADHYYVADPSKCPTIEVGFYNGQEDPDLFVANSDTIGSMFTADKLQYKIRHAYGVKALDWRPFYWQNV